LSRDSVFGLVVNPIAGMGGSVGLKGTDGSATLERARDLGAVPQALERTRRALGILATSHPHASILAAPGPLGADAADGLELDIDVLATGRPERAKTTAADTIDAAKRLAEAKVSTILFAGGDGTARDIAGAVGLETPMLGIPCGVKMQSGVFAVSPEAAGRLAADLLERGDRRVGFRKVEIMDIDEDAVRGGHIAPRLFGYARAPYARNLLQAAKGSPATSDNRALEVACAEIAADMEPGTLYLIGPGTSAKRVLDALGLEGTLLGVDAVRDGALVGTDLTAEQCLSLAGDGTVRIVVGVTGGQGFVFGRGNQPIGPDVIRRAGRDGLIIIAGGDKLAALPEPRLHLDTGDPDLDRKLAGHTRVVTGPGRSMMMRLG